MGKVENPGGGDVKSAILREGVKSELWRVAGGGKPKFSGGGLCVPRCKVLTNDTAVTVIIPDHVYDVKKNCPKRILVGYSK